MTTFREITEGLLMEKENKSSVRGLINRTRALLKSLMMAEDLINGGADPGIRRTFKTKMKNFKFHQNIGHINIAIEGDTVIISTDVRLFDTDDVSKDVHMQLKVKNNKLFDLKVGDVK